MLHHQLSKSERKKFVKRIEYHLRNYNNYKVGILHLKKQLDHILPKTTSTYEAREESFNNYGRSSSTESVAMERMEGDYAQQLEQESNEYSLIIEAIDDGMKVLDEIEYKFVKYRYFNDWSIEKCAMKIGYSDKMLFVIRNQLMDKLLISLGGIKHI
ncbi:hypothetical protein [Alkalihalobacillus sp. AL-G]|uniref:hypothetical protein n=1 Tax=Alkalihalobacillus sp. AL-G TaxID=2926399 RepID=UPI002729D7F6|nr:hypothetical protein [Alkalihalobacillus sp. AL-G]WLD92649.1 hypothetical protein MOJ78_16765 [Alkalihalobacillus sp. AL-G]